LTEVSSWEPLRSEIYTVQQLEELACELARDQRVNLRGGSNVLLKKLRLNAHILKAAYSSVYASAGPRQRISPAGEWLLDNYYLIEEHIRIGWRHLPRSYSLELPLLTHGQHAGFPRVYAIAAELISHADGRIEYKNLSQFVAAYQSVADLKLGELWAIPIMLRLALIENLSRVSARIAREQVEHEAAGLWAQRIADAAKRNPTEVLYVAAEMALSGHAMSKSFVVDFSRRLQMGNQDFSIALTWIDQHLSEQGVTREQLIHEESQSQAADQVSIGNTISSLRTLQAIDWREFVESLSSVERALREDPSGDYAKMDFSTRDFYRHAVEFAAKRTRGLESDVAARAVELARHAAPTADARKRHAGYYLIDDGMDVLDRAIRARPSKSVALKRAAAQFALPLYAGSILSLTALFTVVVGNSAWGLDLGVAIPALLALALTASHFAVSFVNWISTRNIAPRHTPRMDLSEGVPDSLRTVVVVPTMLTSHTSTDGLLEKLEIRFLGNRDPHLLFALLTDLKDGREEILPDDAAVIDYAAAGIAALNRKYGQERFFLFHRPRKWNPEERVWMGYERKRGKLADFNDFLLHGKKTAFSCVAGNVEHLKNIKYVITLDTDTQLPKDSAKEMIAAMAHPLNRPVFDEKLGRVIHGYTILQPTAAIHLTSAQATPFSALFSGEPGIDPYTQTISEVYQDIFGEGSFIGKGIYDVAMFERVLGQRLPENRILSHDLLEGCYVRATLVTDVLLFEEFPARYLTDMTRRHRWIRGDWQIMRWLMPSVPTLDGTTAPNPLSMLSRWKIADNLRRSVVPLAMLGALLVGWFAVAHALNWTSFVLLAIFFPLLTTVCTELLAPFVNGDSVSFRSGLHSMVRSAWGSAVRQVLTLAFLPYEAIANVDAALRTLYRLWFSRRRLLEWTTASESDQASSTSLQNTYRTMWVAPATGVCVMAALVAWGSDAALFAFPIALLWVLAPAMAWRISCPARERTKALSQEDLTFLRHSARRIWSFFETYAGADDNWLPPDNFQEYPGRVVAHRTSPTNIGMGLLSNLSAYDLGYAPALAMLERSRKTLATMQRMERHRGHFYNWYDTQTLRPLLPLYISTVDSGNLAGHLLVFRRGLLEIADGPLVQEKMLAGLRDTLDVLMESKAGGAGSTVPRAPAFAVSTHISKIQNVLQRPVPTHLLDLLKLYAEIRDTLRVYAAHPEYEASGRNWVPRMLEALDEAERHVLHFAPWMGQPEIRDLLSKEKIALWLLPLCSSDISIGEMARMREHLKNVTVEDGEPEARAALLKNLALGAEHAVAACAEVEAQASLCHSFAAMDFEFLFDAKRELFTIGFNVSEHRLDASFYDLFASEARLTSYVAIAQGQVSQEHWFSLGRNITAAGGEPTLVSWSGSMFEYLMPLLVMPDYEGTLLHQTYKGIVARQIEYGRQRHVPWGISESGYNLTDAHLNYQYRAFGVPGLGLKRGLSDDLVIAPYACSMALMVDAGESIANLRRLERDGREGEFGFYEAIDYTPARLPPGADCAVVRSYMAHHQGMALLSINYVLCNQPMQRRFIADPILKSIEMLLHERVPRNAGVVQPNEPETSVPRGVENECCLHVVKDPSTAIPEVHLLSNGRYHVMVNAAGAGYSRWNDLSLTRWRADSVRDGYGLFCFVRDLRRKETWSTSHQPSLRAADSYEAIFSQGRAEFRRSDFEIDIHTEISVAAEDDIEVRRITITNQSAEVRELEITTFGEVVMATQGADLAHPAFSNLFVQTFLDEPRGAIFCTRRARSGSENPPWMVHLLNIKGTEIGVPTYDTDRSKFIGRCRSIHDAAAMSRENLENSQGSVLDPVVSIRRKIRLIPYASARLDLICGIAASRVSAESLADKYNDQHMSDRVFEMAWTQSQVMLRQLNATEIQAQVFARLAGSIIYPSHHRRANPVVLAKNRRGQSGLWGYGISGDLPIVLLRIADPENLDLVRKAVQAHAYWRMRGLAVDLVISNDDASTYRQALYDEIMTIITSSTEAHWIDKPGGIFVRRADQITEEDRTLLQTVAGVVLNDSEGTFQEQVERRTRSDVQSPRLKPSIVRRENLDRAKGPAQRALPADLLFFNGFGGFSPDGREYVMTLPGSTTTPAPWVNVIANPTFGTVVSESGAAYTWLENSHEFRLTPWNNDPVTDASGEAFYIRDEESGEFWSPTPLPVRGKGTYAVRHGFGYSVHECSEGNMYSRMTTFVAMDAPVKFVTLKLRNESAYHRRMSLTGYFEWVLGELRTRTQMHVLTEVDTKTGAMLARNRYSPDFPDRIAFLDCSERNRTVTGDRAEFIGRNGTLQSPLAMGRSRLSGRVGAGLDACAAMQTQVVLAPGQERDVVFVLGVGRDAEDVQRLLERFCNLGGAREALDSARDHWTRTLGAVQVETPDTAVNLLANGWLLYQTLSCRMWARTGFYQSGGAYGFRDQLQDSMALLHCEPTLFRNQILRAAAHQFRQGDVQHWWHPPLGRGVRTHFSDDYLWLPFAVCRYVKGTGDTGVLNETIPFIEGRPVNQDEEAYYDLPLTHEESGTLYEHCVRAIRNGLKVGVHGLPLIGCGDWNDGMNRIGEEGKGESVWLAFFLYDVLTQFVPVAQMRGDAEFAKVCIDHAAQLKKAIETEGWDGQWYRRAYFDDGEPLGSAANTECRIDSLPQSWSVLSEAGDHDRSVMAMNAVDQHLVRRDAGLIQLFDPPFDKAVKNPGYIKGYVPGVRENGGQYTHAAIWTIMAFAKLGNSARAWELLTIVNPLNHARSYSDALLYKVEPYVVAADVYAVAPHTGRGGWTWYTGSAGWMYRLLVESLLGVEREGSLLRIHPCLPKEWPEFKIRYRYGSALYKITIKAGKGKAGRMIVDGIVSADNTIALTDDGLEHLVVAELGEFSGRVDTRKNLPLAAERRSEVPSGSV